MSFTQRETPVLAQLCELLVEDHYGELAARVFSILARYGRQTLGSLSRASYLTSRQVKYGLVILIQQHLIFHSGALLDAGPTQYEIDWQQSYALVRYGRILEAVHDRFGEKAANVMSNLLTLGHTQIKDLREAYFPPATYDSDADSDTEHPRKTTNGTKANGTAPVVNGTSKDLPDELNGSKLVNGDGHANGVNGSKKRKYDEEPAENSSPTGQTINSVEELDAIIHGLMLQGWIMKLDERQYLGPGDYHAIARDRAIEHVNNGVKPTGTKDKERVAYGTLEQKRMIRDEWLALPRFSTRKRKMAEPDLERTTKRLRVGGPNEWSVPRGEVVVLDEDLIVRANPEKTTVALRTDLLVALVESRIGHATGRVYGTLLRLLEDKLARSFEEWPDPVATNPDTALDLELDRRMLVTAREVAKAIDPNVNLFEGLDPHAIVQLANGHSQVDKHNRINPPIDPFHLDVDEKTKFVDKHIRYLADDPFHFVTWHSRNGYSEWHVEFEEISKTLIQHEIEHTIAAGTEKEKTYGVKLIRALLKKGKLDERQMSNTMMMPALEVRSVINALTIRGFIQTQEIPKVERREAKHSLHLIWYDVQRSREKLLHDTYKGMIRILQRMSYEKQKVETILTKAERSDVVGKEEMWLNQYELDSLKKFKEVQAQLALQLSREDELVAILRDFHGPLVTA